MLFLRKTYNSTNIFKKYNITSFKNLKIKIYKQ